jgi:hypothetical protein
MKRTILVTGLLATLALALPAGSWAESTGTMGVQPVPMEKGGAVDQARMHLNAALDEGRKQNTTGIVQHAEAGLEQVRKAREQKASPDFDRAVQNLEEAIRQGKAGDANKAVERVEAALNNLDAAKGAMGG